MKLKTTLSLMLQKYENCSISDQLTPETEKGLYDHQATVLELKV